jgi:hypothetical protein
MIFLEQFDAKVKDLWASLLSRVRVKKFKSGKRAGMVRVPAQALPFNRDELAAMLMKFCGLGPAQCPYCNVPIDILSLTLDHKIPLALGGSHGLDNLMPCCQRCNKLKEKLLPHDFMYLMKFLETCSTALRANLEARLLGQLRRYDFNKKQRGPNWVPPPKEQQIPLEEDF